MLEGVKKGMLSIAKIFSVNHISKGSPGVTFLIVFNTTPLPLIIKRTLQL